MVGALVGALTGALVAGAWLTAPHVAPGLAPEEPASAPADTARCAEAARFLREVQRMVVAVEPDTMDDWRTRRRLAGCRVTAAGGSDVGVAREAVRLYERVRAAGWVRTPEPRDAPSEASLRFRRGDADCLFNVTRDPLLMTEAEERVNAALVLRPGDARYQVFVMCTPALPAAAQRGTAWERSQVASASSSSAPAAMSTIVPTTSGSEAVMRRPFSPRKTYMAWNAIRLLPSMNGWFRATPKP